MLKLGKLTDYAVVVMVQLARDGVSRSASYLSDKTGLPEPTVAKVLKQLAKEKLVEATRGALGGYKITRAPEEISLAGIVTAMDGPIALASCVGGNEGCKSQGKCPARGNWDRVNGLIAQALDSVTLAEMAVPPRQLVQLREAQCR
jgi:FeS assembly SUF system regulator